MRSREAAWASPPSPGDTASVFSAFDAGGADWPSMGGPAVQRDLVRWMEGETDLATAYALLALSYCLPK